MFRYLFPIILIGVSITGFFLVASPVYQQIGEKKAEVAGYNTALDNAKELANERDKLTQKLNSINAENLDRLTKLLPENVDNIRLILEIEKIAAPFGMAIKDVKYDARKKTNEPEPDVALGGTPSEEASKEFGTLQMSFATEGTYTNFINFLKSLESNLRIVDISSIEFSSSNLNVGPGSGGANPEIYRYDFKIKTYWLKN